MDRDTIHAKLAAAAEFDRLGDEAEQTTRDWAPDERAQFVAECRRLARQKREEAGVTEVPDLKYPEEP